MSYTATVCYSRDAEHFIDIFTAIYKFLCGPIRSFYMKDQIFLPFHIQCTSTCWIHTVHIPEAWKRYPFRAAPPCIGHYGRNPPPPPPPTVDPESSSLLGVFTNFVINSSKIEGKWIVWSKDKVPKTFCHKMAWRTDQNPWVILLLLHQTFAPQKKCIKRLDSVKKKRNYKHLVFKGSFYLWESNNNKFFILPKLNTCGKSEIWNNLKINDD